MAGFLNAALCVKCFVQGAHLPTGDIRGGEYPVACVPALNRSKGATT
ncbi:hypothetical protein J2X67_001812 [Variovorax sp. 3319]|nr:hypothetical protein [Variovorax sp. 3319]